MVEFKEFPKIPRLFREIVITEKIDGTNAQVIVCEDGVVAAASRSRIITPEQDNFGFAKWVKEHEEELRAGLGLGRHFGEWWGDGIQRKYGQTSRRFSLFNVSKWGENRPACCDVVPTMYRGNFSENAVASALGELRQKGSVAAPGFMRPEGVVVYHTASGCLFKATCENDNARKGEQNG